MQETIIKNKVVSKDELLYWKAVDNVMDTYNYSDMKKETLSYIYTGGTKIETYNRPANRPKYDCTLSDKKASKFKDESIKTRIKAEGLPVREEEREKIYSALNNKETGKAWLEEKKGDLSNRDIIEEVKHDNFSHFEKLDEIFRDTLATNYILNYMAKKNINEGSLADNVNFNDYIEESEMFNPLFRLGLSQMARLQEKRNINNGLYRAIDNEIARRIMVRTLASRLEDDEILSEQYADAKIRKPGMNDDEVQQKLQEVYKKEKGKQAQMAKQLMLMHLGGIFLVKKDVIMPCDVPVASVIAHCSRTLVHTPFYNVHREKYATENDFKEAEKRMWTSILNHYNSADGTYENSAEIHARGSSTHTFRRRRAHRRFATEHKLLMNLIGQTGMTVAIGGLGQPGVSDNMLDIDGTCGYVYAMKKESDNNIAGGYLFGYESDSYKKTNQMGHTHDLHATPEKSSSFGCQRRDEIGEKYGGRQADLSGYTPDTIVLWMNTIDKAMDSLNGEMRTRFLDIISGKRLLKQNIDDLMDCLNGVVSDDVKTVLKSSFIENYRVQ